MNSIIRRCYGVTALLLVCASIALAQGTCTPPEISISALRHSDISGGIKQGGCFNTVTGEYRFLGSASTADPLTIGAINLKKLNGAIRYADQFSGSDACAKIAAAIADLPTTGGVVDASGFVGNNTCAVNPFAGVTKSVRLLLGAATFVTDGTWILPTKTQMSGIGRGDASTRNTTIKASASFPTSGAYVVQLGDSATGIAFGVRVENLSIDCNSVTACGGVFSDTINEQSGLDHVSILNTKGKAIYFDSVNGAQNYCIRNIEVNTTTLSTGIHLKGDFVQCLESVTVNGDDLSGSNSGTGILLESVSGKFNNLHVEHAGTGIDIRGDNMVLNGVAVGPYIGTDGVKITSGQNITVAGLYGTAVGGNYNLLNDTVKGTTLNTASVSELGLYSLGDGATKSVISTSTAVPSVIVPGLTVYSFFASNGQVNFGSGVNSDGAGFKHKRFGATTATTATAGATTTNTFSWSSPFADANYTVTCQGVNPTGNPSLSISAVPIAASVMVKTTAITAVASSFGAVDCVAVHD